MTHSGLCPHFLLLTWDIDVRLRKQQPSLDHEERAKTLAPMGLFLAWQGPFCPFQRHWMYVAMVPVAQSVSHAHQCHQELSLTLWWSESAICLFTRVGEEVAESTMFCVVHVPSFQSAGALLETPR